MPTRIRRLSREALNARVVGVDISSWSIRGRGPEKSSDAKNVGIVADESQPTKWQRVNRFIDVRFPELRIFHLLRLDDILHWTQRRTRNV